MPPDSPIDLLVALLAEPPDLSVLRDAAAWEAIKENAGRFGVAPLVASVARSHVTAEERAWCDRVLVQSWTRHDRMLGHLEFVLGVLGREGIPTIALKGPLLAQRYYAPALLRKPSMDLDLAVAGGDIDRACRVLAGEGFTLDMPVRDAFRQSHHVMLSHVSRPGVELHFRLSHAAVGIPVEEFFERTVAMSLPGGLEARVLGASDRLLHLALHLAHARFGTLFYLYEVRRVWRAESAEVRAEALRRAVERRFCGVLRMIDVAFRVRWGEAFLGPEAAVPATWLNGRLTPELYGRFEKWSWPGRELSLGARLQGRWLDFLITDGLRDGLRLAALFGRTAAMQVAEMEAWRTRRELRFVPGRR
jgi:Uncharacterised nucleotidyltransferase